MYNLKTFITLFSLSILFMLSCSPSHAQQTTDANFEIAPIEYADLAAKAIGHIEQFDWPEFYEMLSDDVAYYLPDGGPKTRTALIGKPAVKAFWDSYEEKSGNSKIIVSDEVHLPVISKKEIAYTKLTGVLVLSYFTLDMEYGKESVELRMNWGMHFNADKKIDKIYTYYDRTPIIEAAKRNFLTQGNKE